MPFGKPKPEFAVQIDRGSQKLKFEWKNGIGIIDFNVYPDLTYQKLAQNFNLHLGTTDTSLRRALRDMNQTEYETNFFLHYAKTFNMANKNIPILIPQAWIQWHSQSKKYLNPTSSLNINDIYTVELIIEGENDYIITIKRNQPNLLKVATELAESSIAIDTNYPG